MSRVRYFGNPAQGSISFGSNTIVDGEIITIGDKIYELRAAGSASAGHVLVGVGGTATLTAAALVAAINANKPTVPVTASVDPITATVVRLVADAPGAAGNIALLEGVADAGVVVSGATLVGGENAGTQTVARGKYTVTANDVTATSIVIETGLVSPRFATIETYSSTGAKKTSTGLLTISGSKLLVDFTGSTDHAATDVIVWSAWE